MTPDQLLPYTLICLYLNTLSEQEMSHLKAISEEYCGMRYDSSAINSLEKQGMLRWEWKSMEIELTEQGIEHAKNLVREIAER